MDNTLFKTGLRFYQSANADAQSIKENFIIRRHEYDIIVDDLQRNGRAASIQHYLLLGRRGSGKSTLLKRIQIEIDANENLQQLYIAINLAEEQANIYRLFDLLEDIHEELQHRGLQVEEVPSENDAHAYARLLFAAIHTAINASGKKLVLLLDNIDRIFENLGKDAHLLREYLLNYSDIKIIGGSTRMTEHFWKYDMPFYDFFRVLKLEPLTRDEVKQLLLHWGEKQQLPALKEFVQNRAGQLETVRILTDGLPRTLQFFVNLIINKTDASGYEYLRQIIDYMTPQYQERLNALPPSQRKIVLQLAFIWESTGVKELAEAVRMDNKVISAQLKQLADKGIVDKQETSNKNNLYRLNERFFNLWLIFTQGSPHEKRRAKYLTVFLENFYDEEELKRLAEDHLSCLSEGKMAADKAVVLTKAYAQSRFISLGTRDALIKRTLQLKDITNLLKIQLPERAQEVLGESKSFAKAGNWQAALKKINEIEQSNDIIEFVRALCNDEIGNLREAEKHYLKSITYDPAKTSLADLYRKQNKYELAEKYYLMAIETKDTEAMGKLAKLYREAHKIDEAERYYLMAIEHNNLDVVWELAALYFFEKKKKKDSLTFVTHWYYLTKDENLLPLVIAIKIWNGIFDEVYEHFELLVTNSELDLIKIALQFMLALQQTNLVMKLFSSPEFGQKLKDNFLPLYYATQLLVTKEPNVELKLPPELGDTVSKLVNDTRVMQDYYAN